MMVEGQIRRRVAELLLESRQYYPRDIDRALGASRAAHEAAALIGEYADGPDSQADDLTLLRVRALMHPEAD